MCPLLPVQTEVLLSLMFGSPQSTIIWPSWNSTWQTVTRADWVWGAEWGVAFLRSTFIDFNQNWLHNWGPAVADWTSFGRPSEALCCSLLALYNHGEPAVSYPQSYTSQFSSLAWEGHWGWIGWICTSSFPPSARDAPGGFSPPAFPPR